jgi:hypothetical protein
MVKLNLLIALVLALFIATGVNAEADEDQQDDDSEFYSEKTVISTGTSWLSDNPEDLNYIIDVEGTPQEVYIIDVQAQDEIYHMEDVYHPARKHTEYVYGTYYIVHYLVFDDLGSYHEDTFADYTSSSADDAWMNAATSGYEVANVTTTEGVISSYEVIDQAAYTGPEKVIDVEAREEQGHYETVIVGEIGHFENKYEIKPATGEGHFVAFFRKYDIHPEEE